MCARARSLIRCSTLTHCIIVATHSTLCVGNPLSALSEHLASPAKPSPTMKIAYSLAVAAVAILVAPTSVKAARPANDQCSGATEVNPVAGGSVVGETSEATDEVGVPHCDVFNGHDQTGVWYTFRAPSRLSVTVSTCTQANFDTQISVYSGSGCGDLNCVVGDDDACDLSSRASFETVANSQYWVLVHGFDYGQGDVRGTFHLDLSSLTIPTAMPTAQPSAKPSAQPSALPSYFRLYDADTDGLLGVLGGNVNYTTLSASSLNIQANFASDLPPISSVRVTFDQPARTFCETSLPYTVFGDDTRGDYFGATIPLGSHVVTATPYSQSGCRGTPGRNVSQAFQVSGCSVRFDLYDGKTNLFNATLTRGFAVSFPPCAVNIEAVVTCGFPVKRVALALTRNTTNAVAASRAETAYPYFLFGDDGAGDVFSGTIAAGNYTVSATINGIAHPAHSFTLGRCA